MLPLLTSLLHPSAPAWLRVKFATTLSLLPLRENGARQVINFIAASYPASLLDPVDGRQNSSQGLVLPLDALAQMSKLLSSVPASMTPEVYFTALAPQLWDLLDAKDDPEMRKAAGYIIGSGILGKKTLGAPDKIGWKLFAKPLLKALNPDGDEVKGQASTSLTDEVLLATALRRLTAIVTSHPSPGLTRRLLRPVILPLWGLLSYSKRNILSPMWADTSSNLLRAFFRHCAQTEHYMLIAENLLWDGPDRWTFGFGSEGGIQIKGREVKKEDPFNLIQSLVYIDASVNCFLELLASSDVEAYAVVTVFLATTRRWLLAGERGANKNMIGAVRESDPFETLVSAKLAQAMLDRFRDQIVKEPSKLVELVEQLLTEYLKQKTTDRSDIPASPGLPDSKKLRNLISESRSQEDQHLMVENALNEESTDIVVVALSLLDTIIASESVTIKSAIRPSLNSLLPFLDALRSSSKITKESSISTLAGNLARTIRQPAPPSDNSHSTGMTSDNQSVQNLYNKALENLSSELAPIRVEGLATLQELIASQSPQISIPAITLLFTHDVLTDPDSFVHLAGIRTLVLLATHDVRLVTRLLADVFIDPKEEEGNGLDVRLAVGETLGCIVQAMVSDYDLGNSKYVEEATGWKIHGKTETRIRCDHTTKSAALRIIVLAMLRVGGRRGERVKSKQTRERKAALAGQKQKEAEDAWGGEVPQLEEEEEDDDDDRDGNSKGASQETTTLLQNILHGWENTGLEEDIRLRASALSILGQVLELHCTALDAGLLLSGVDLALQIIGSHAEARPERALVRRAAVLALAMLVRGVNRACEGSSNSRSYQDQRRNETLMQSVGWQNIDSKLRWSSEMDEDEIVKGHARTAMDELEAWRVKRVLGLNGKDNGTKGRTSLEFRGTSHTIHDSGNIRLAGLNVDLEIRDGGKENYVKNSKGRRSRWRVVEEIE